MTMKRVFISILGSFFILALAACSNEDPSVDNHPKEQLVPGEEEENPNTPDEIRIDDSDNKSSDGQVEGDSRTPEMMEELNFTSFELDVEYGHNEYEFDYEERQNGDYQAELKDSVHEKYLKGVEAFNALHTQFSNQPLEADTPKEEMIQLILDRFQLSDDYTSFELEYTLRDGTKVEIEDR